MLLYVLYFFTKQSSKTFHKERPAISARPYKKSADVIEFQLRKITIYAYAVVVTRDNAIHETRGISRESIVVIV